MKLWFGCKHKRLSPPRLRETATPDVKKDAVYVQSCMDCGKDLSYKPSAHEVKILESLEQRNLIQANEETTNFWGESGRRLLKLERLDKKYPQKVSSKSSSEHAPVSNPKASFGSMPLEARHRLAVLYHDRGNLREAETLYRELIHELEVMPEGGGVELDQVLNNLAMLLTEEKQLMDAEKAYKRSINELALRHGEKAPKLVRRMASLGELYLSMEANAEAQMTFTRALLLAEEVLPGDHADLQRVLRGYAKALRKGNRLQNALDIEARLVAILDLKAMKA